MAKLVSVRSTLFRPYRGNRRIAIKDACTAYLQANKYDGFVKYVCFRDPVTGHWRYFRQYGPIYGEASAARRWQDTVSPWIEEQGFTRGDNERCIFYNSERDLLILMYVDDFFLDGDEEDIIWFCDRMEGRFDCKPTEWLDLGEDLDYLGQEIILTKTHLHLSMFKYIQDLVDLVELRQSRSAPTPIATSVDSNSAPLAPPQRKLFMTIMGCVGWLVNTARPDVAYAHSRVAQHMASPTESALDAAKRIVRYLKGAAHYTLAVSITEPDLTTVLEGNAEQGGWSFFCDTDFAGNAEPQNARRSQNGSAALRSGAPVQWASKVSSVAFAHPAIGEAHADISSGAVEVYGSANATFEFLYLGYISEEAGHEFPQPILLQLDNSAAQAFIERSAAKTKLKHIDCRQEWVKVLRDKEILKPVHVDSKDNVADLFTKILPRTTFERLRDLVMVPMSRDTESSDKSQEDKTVDGQVLDIVWDDY